MTEATSSQMSNKLNSYSAEEVELIYSLGRFYLESGFYYSAEIIFNGLCTIAPDYVPAWIGRSIVKFIHNDIDNARADAHQAFRLIPESVEAQLMLITLLISSKDYSAAGTKLGEIQDLITNKRLNHPDLIRYFKAQLIRYEKR